jgi:hypothetical protein
MVVEATYGWYWAVDVLEEAGAEVHLAHPLGIKTFTYRRVKDDERDAADHYRVMITAAWQLGGTRHDGRFRAWAHMLGYGGHFLTKSRRYSVTFGQLRQDRADHHCATRPRVPGRDAWDRPWTRRSSWSCPPSGPTAEPNSTRPRRLLSWPQPLPHTPASTQARPIPVDNSVSTGP